MEYLTLNNGIRMPQLGLGLRGLNDPDICEQVVLAAFREGYRLLDTAQLFHNERYAGKAIASAAVPREEIFITTKLPPARYDHDPRKHIEASLKRLKCESIDLLLLNYPVGDIKSGYRTLEWAFEQGLARSIGVSNFYLISQLRALEAFANIPPAVNQIECHPFQQHQKLSAYMKEQGIVPEAWMPLARERHIVVENPVIMEIARRHRRTPIRVILRWHIQSGHIVIPGTRNPDHMRSNLHCFDLVLSDEDMRLMNSLDMGHSFMARGSALRRLFQRIRT